MLINAYLHELAGDGAAPAPKVGWDFEDESPGNDARGDRAAGRDAARGRDPPRQRRAHQRRPLLRRPRPPRAARRPSAPTPARSCVFDRAAEQILQRSMAAATRHAARRARRSSSTRTTPTARATATAATRTTSWTARCRSAASSPTPRRTSSPARSSPARARSGTEAPALEPRRGAVPAHASGPTSSRRRSGSRPRSSGPIVNTRDEPHADAQKYRRLHVIVGDANLREVATFLKVGTTALVLAMIEDDVLPRDFVVRRAGAGHAPGVSYDLTLARAARAGRRHHRSPRSRSSGSCSTGPASTPTSVGLESVGEAGRRRGAAPLGGACSPGSRPTR